MAKAVLFPPSPFGLDCVRCFCEERLVASLHESSFSRPVNLPTRGRWFFRREIAESRWIKVVPTRRTGRARLRFPALLSAQEIEATTGHTLVFVMERGSAGWRMVGRGSSRERSSGWLP